MGAEVASASVQVQGRAAQAEGTRIDHVKPESTTETAVLPLVAVVGRPNVGKSTLFNRLTGRRQAIVDSKPGSTRDRAYGRVEWQRKEFSIVDTGGLSPRVRPAKVMIPATACREYVTAGQNRERFGMHADGTGLEYCRLAWVRIAMRPPQ